MKLLEKQFLFAECLSNFILTLIEMGYRVKIGEVLRTKEMAEIYAQHGMGIKNSNHLLSIAVDLQLFKNNIWLTRTEDYEPAGELWESYSTKEVEFCWGGRFGDSDHFSIAHNGVK
jgi:hypothetical protein